MAYSKALPEDSEVRYDGVSSTVFGRWGRFLMTLSCNFSKHPLSHYSWSYASRLPYTGAMNMDPETKTTT